MKINLKNRVLYRVSGPDSQTFLQSQFSNNINQLSNNEIQLNCYCQHQGKILAIVWVFKYENTFFISFLKELEGLILSKLNMFKLMSEVKFEDFTEKYNIFGVLNETNNDFFVLGKGLNILVTKDKFQSAEIELWEKLCIDNSIPEITLINSEKYTPQVLNLDIDEIGVSFKKGCYPGQEVVARMHYLGKAKRRMFQFFSNSEVKIGDSLNVANSTSFKSSGEVIRTVKIRGKYYFLGTIEVMHIGEKIFLNKDLNQTANIVHVE